MSVRHTYPDRTDFVIDRKNGHKHFTFLHFYNSMEVVIEGERIITSPHAVILYTPGTPQYFANKNGVIHDWFHFRGSIDDLPLEHFKPNQILYPSSFDYITKTVAELENEFFSGKKNSAVLSDALVRALFIKLDRSVAEKEENVVSAELDNRFRNLRGEIFSSLDADWSVAKMADRLNFSESRFYTLYKTIFGISPTADLINAKINSAKNILQFQNSKIEDIAVSLGYKNVTHFIRQFKSVVGISPNEYRKANR